MFVLTRYQGTESGYVPVGRARPWAAALLLLSTQTQSMAMCGAIGSKP